MSELKQTMQHAREFIAANLAECCRDELNWQDTGLLVDGKLREASEIYALVEDAHAMPMAQAEVARQAMQLACRTQPEATNPAQDLQLVVATSTETGVFHVVINVNDGKRSLVLYDKQHSLNGDTVGVADIPFAALASPADALVEGDRVDADHKLIAEIISKELGCVWGDASKTARLILKAKGMK